MATDYATNELVRVRHDAFGEGEYRFYLAKVVVPVKFLQSDVDKGWSRLRESLILNAASVTEDLLRAALPETAPAADTPLREYDITEDVVADIARIRSRP
jgi:hypothetical protein